MISDNCVHLCKHYQQLYVEKFSSPQKIPTSSALVNSISSRVNCFLFFFIAIIIIFLTKRKIISMIVCHSFSSKYYFWTHLWCWMYPSFVLYLNNIPYHGYTKYTCSFSHEYLDWKIGSHEYICTNIFTTSFKNVHG